MPLGTDAEISIIYTASPDSLLQYWAKVWRFRRLILTFVYQEFKTQYVQTRLNFLWVLLRPLAVLAIFTFLFDRVIHIPELKYPYPLFAFTGLIVWNNFSFMVNNGSGVILANQSIIRNMYFPRIILLLSKSVTSLIELGICLVLALLLQMAYGYAIHWQVLLVPFFVLLNLITGLSIAVWLNAVNVKYRDLNLFIPYIIGFLIWLTPVFYPATLVPRQLSFLVYLNPVAGAIQGLRWALYGDAFTFMYYLPGFIFMAIALITGIYQLIKIEKEIPDYI